VIPSSLIIPLLVPLLDTAQNKPFAGDQQTERHDCALALVLLVHVMPSGEVIT
jgi:hypothetical protein